MDRRHLIALAVVALGCDRNAGFRNSGLGPDEIPLHVDRVCPGDASCPAGGDPQLRAGFALREITPIVEPWDDLNHDGVWEPNEPFTDLDGDGQYDAYWIANSSTGRQIRGVHDPLWVRCTALAQGQTTVAHCAFDLLGYMHDEGEQIRADLDPALGVDLLLTSATHTHSGPDPIGIFGPDDLVSGYKPRWMQRVRRLAVEAIAEAVGKLRPAKLSIASAPVEEGADHDMTRYIDDSRDPAIIDNVMHLVQLDDAATGAPIVTLVNWTAHPDSQDRGNRYISSEWPHYLRERVEAHTGGPAVYVSGSVGGQIGPGRVSPVGDDGTAIPAGERSWRFIEAWGQSIGDFANRLYDARTPVASPALAFRTARFAVHVENNGYQAAFATHTIPRLLYGYDPARPQIRDASGDNTPLVDTEVAHLTLGPVAIATVPGELFPEDFIGGYDGSRHGTWEPFIHTGPIPSDACMCEFPAPPDVSLAPKSPYLIDLMGGEPAHRMIFGLTMDMLGYIVPQYNFYLDPIAPYLQEPPGDNHYEETNSIGPRAEPEIVGTLRQLAISAQPGQAN
jgi:hypothetical protein